jgi:glycosyltransferase involved in cell wall biosynthesis
MRIGVDATAWSNRRGYGRFARSLLHAVLAMDRANSYLFFSDYESSEFPFPANAEVCLVKTGRPTVAAAAADSHRSLADLWAVARAMRASKSDLIFFPSEYSYVPALGRTPQIVTLHDAIAELWPDKVFPNTRARMLFGAKKRLAIWQATLLLTVSEHSRRLLARELRIPLERLRVVSEAPDAVFRPLPGPVNEEASRRWGIPPSAPCLAFVGGFSPHKNLLMLVEVVAEIVRQDSLRELRLVLVGETTTETFHSCWPQLSARVREAGIERSVLFTGRLPDGELNLVLNRCDALVLPSFCEGFGLPAVEAAACGKPVLVTTESPIPELLGQGALAVSPADQTAWRNAIVRLLLDRPLRLQMAKAALAAAAGMTWEKSARQLLAAFEDAGGAHASA